MWSVFYLHCFCLFILTVTTPSIVTDGEGAEGPTLIEGCDQAFGCCEDGITPSLGPDFEGCPGRFKRVEL